MGREIAREWRCSSEEKSRKTEGQDTRELKCKSYQNRQIPGRRLMPTGEGNGFSQWK